ncbi:MAG: hypothetical protein E7L17_13830 [Clostridium sp.]|uniref:hypothetical protein n=1 Tax=Clostridium sp. TaxID=1506 RepID=UPI00290DE039|nr:hypothetical protein [Clostridium sp.]MDU7339180.1 hypothetical protein [Clostridium sp.]
MTNLYRRVAVTLVAICTSVTMLAGCSLHKKNTATIENSIPTPSEIQTVVKPTNPDSGKNPTAKPFERPMGTRGTFSSSFFTLQKLYNLAAVPTYDGYNQSTHPKILYFPKRWNGYEYWMSITPYPFGNDDYENPCIVASNDGKTWVTPAGLKNPISGIPSDVKQGAHYSDSHLVMTGDVMEMWYRYNKGNPKTKRPDSSMDYYYRTISSNGLDWSVPQLMQQSKAGILSLAVNHENNQYQFWYTTSQKKLMHATSIDGTAWTDTKQCTIELPVGYLPWHQDVIHYQGTYYLLQTGIMQKNYSFALFLSKSTDGVNFTKGVPFYPSNNPVILEKTWLYRSTVYADGNSLRMMVSYRLPQKKWYMTGASITVQQWNDACDKQKPLILQDRVLPTKKKTEDTVPPKTIQKLSEENFGQNL